MSDQSLSYAKLLETNNLIQRLADDSYWLCVTRTVQESKLFPVSPYMILSYLMAFYRYPALLRKIEAHMPAEEIADRVRNSGGKLQTPHISWCLPSFYLLGREVLQAWGLLRPEDAVDDIVTVMDFWKRYMLSWHRNNGHFLNSEYGHRAQILSEAKLQVFHADMYECEEGDELHTAATAFAAAVAQFGFLISCESRVSMSNHGPYKLDDSRELLVREFMDLSEYDYPWMDDIGSLIPYNNLTMPMAVRDCHFYLVDDWGSFESKPEFKSHHMCGVGLYTSSALSDGYLPVGMGSREELTQTFKDLTAALKQATTKLWARQAGWSRDQMIDAGAIVYYSMIKELAHVAGCYEMEDWMLVDERANRFRGLLNDEYANLFLGELVGTLTNPAQRLHEYSMMRQSNTPSRMYALIPYSVLDDDQIPGTVGDISAGVSTLPEKNNRYTTTEGVLSQDDYNQRVQAFTPFICDGERNRRCETWLKHHFESPEADEIYQFEQRNSRNLAGRGAGLSRADIEAIRASNGS